MKEENSWNLIKKVGKIKKIDEGGDSVVYSIKDKETGAALGVAKNYDNLTFGYGGVEDPKNVEKILKEYYLDTIRAIKILEKNSNPLNQSIDIYNESYAFNYKIIPQGDFILEQKKEVDYAEEKETIKSSVGQEFVDGINLHLLVEYPKGSQATTEQQAFVKNKFLYDRLTENIVKFFSYLSRQLNTTFVYGAMNIKPFVNKDNKTITIVITDLAGSLKSYYKNSEKFRAPRKQEI